ncbi:MAG: 4-hydroxy-tetrahydrodipicolinate reductase [Bacteroidales bacterium]|nr:4-hydroxy-tetrahydrodipicolinate reductase [Bacteroidales bacterium]HRX30535.1 4-hydroxy-tetrahydrodipicolinate reductase [Tenuifilaceae bacterium]
MRIAIIGYGRMGHEIETMALERGHTVAVKVDNDNADDIAKIVPSEVDVAIEFSNPNSAFSNVTTCLNKGVAIVSGTTGWNDNLFKAIELAQKSEGAFFYSSNFSLGVNIFFKVNSLLSRYINAVPGYSASIREIHHTQKIDAPSGTAITLANIISKEIDNLNGWTLLPQSELGKIPIEAVREGSVPGTHIVTYESEQDKIEFAHYAKSRRGFALGAVIAGEFLQGKKGYFTMDDLLHFE